MRLQIFGGMTECKLLMTLVEYHPVDPETGEIKLFEPDKYAIPGGKVASFKQIMRWAHKFGYKVKKQMTEKDNIY